MPTVTLTPTNYRVLRNGAEDSALPLHSGEDWNGFRRSLMRFAAPSDFAGATINQATLTWTVGYYSGWGESGLSILGIIANNTPFATQAFSPQPLMGDVQRVIRDENYWENVPSLGMVAAAGTELVDDLAAMVAQAMAAGRFAGGEMQFLWTTNEFYSDYHQFTVGTPSLFIDYTPPPLLLSVSATSVGIGGSITGTVTRSGSTSGDLVVTISQTGTNRLTLPATVTILDGQSSQTFAISGAAYGSETLTATAGSDSFSRTITVAPVGLGDEYLWICPSLDEEGDGTTTATDLSGNNRNGTLTDMDAATDWVADTADGGIRALDFDGTDRVTIGTVTASVWTFAAWMRPTSNAPTGAFRRLFGQSGFMLDIAINQSGVLSVFDGSWKTFGSANSLDVWHHIIVTYDGTSLRVYRNGTQIGTTTTGGRALSGATRIADYVSGAAGGDGNQFIGRLDDIRIFSRVIASAERTHLASARAVTGGPPVDALTLDAITRSVGSGLVADFEIAAATLDAITRSIGSGVLAELAYNALTLDAITRSVASGLVADYEINALTLDAITRSVGSGLVARLVRRRPLLFPDQLFPNNLLG